MSTQTKQPRSIVTVPAGNGISVERKLRLENYPKGKALASGRYITVFGKKGIVKLLNSNQLLPANTPSTARFSGFGRELQESFTPQYGYGPAAHIGRFLLQNLKNYDTTDFGWFMLYNGSTDQELKLDVYMGPWAPNLEPAINFMVLELHLACFVQAATLSVMINGAEVNYDVEPTGESKLVFYVNKPVGSNQAKVRIRLKNAENSSGNGLWITSIQRYNSIFVFPDDLETLDI